MGILKRVKERFPQGLVSARSDHGDDTVLVERPSMLTILHALKEEPEFNMNILMDLAGVDYHRRRPSDEVVYHLYSLANNHRLRVKVGADDPDPEVDSATGLWQAADWYEREVWDMFGIRFKGHPNLTRILLYDSFQGHPLRKDYSLTKRQPLVGPKS